MNLDKDNIKPQARQDDLTTEEVRGETLVYDSRTHKAHCLNRTAAAVWECCNGERRISQIAAEVTRKIDAPVDVSMVQTALAELATANLLESAPAIPQPAKISRRQAAATAAVLMPVVASILVPTAAAARSGSERPSGGGDDDNQGEDGGGNGPKGNSNPGKTDNGKGNGGIPGNGKGKGD